MLILVSNDDGVESPGIKALAKAMKKIPGARVVVVAPDREQSATSHSLTLHRPLRLKEKSKDVYAVDGTPADAVMLAVHRVLKKKPDLVISGINMGANLGEDVHYSGTVSAAMEGAIMGIPAIAVSVVGLDNYKFDAAAAFAVTLSKKLFLKGIPRGTVLNVNVPNRPKNEIRGYRFTRLGKHNYGDILTEKIDPRGRPYFWIGGDPSTFEDRDGSDCNAFSERYISVTPIKADLTDHHFLSELKEWKL